MSRVIKAIGVKLQPEAECVDCDRVWERTAWTRDRAKDHAKLTGHTVEVTTSTVDRYRREGDA